MNTARFIARKLSENGVVKGRLSTVSNYIAWISVALSIAIMIIAISIVGGFKSEIRGKAAGFMGSVILVPPGQTPLNEKYPFKEPLSYKESIADLKYVESINSVAYRSGLIKTEDNINGVYFKGIDSLYNLSFFKSALVRGQLPDYSGKLGNDILISGRLAALMGYELGDQVLSYFIGDDVKVRKFTIVGVFDAQLDDIDKTIIVVDKRHIQRLNGWDTNQASCVEIRIDNDKNIDDAAEEIENMVFTSSTDDDPSLFVTSISKFYSHLFDWLALLDLNVLMVLLLMIAVAGFNMISAILIILFEKISMIGLLKSLGMTNRGVSKVFLYRALYIVGKGVVWGNVAACAVCMLQKYFKIITLNPDNYFVKYVPIKSDLGQILLLDAGSIVLIMLILSLSTIFISRVSPDKTLRVN
ncbi:MAG: ABC transporter permease [Bacteroidales bacterium]|nr:ABC transporter permease [Bacteroidales bacterium]MDD4670984.1 ABC transporter permease [Bacteroidales bacterium]